MFLCILDVKSTQVCNDFSVFLDYMLYDFLFIPNVKIVHYKESYLVLSSSKTFEFLLFL